MEGNKDLVPAKEILTNLFQDDNSEKVWEHNTKCWRDWYSVYGRWLAWNTWCS